MWTELNRKVTFIAHRHKSNQIFQSSKSLFDNHYHNPARRSHIILTSNRTLISSYIIRIALPRCHCENCNVDTKFGCFFCVALPIPLLLHCPVLKKTSLMPDQNRATTKHNMKTQFDDCNQFPSLFLKRIKHFSMTRAALSCCYHYFSIFFTSTKKVYDCFEYVWKKKKRKEIGKQKLEKKDSRLILLLLFHCMSVWACFFSARVFSHQFSLIWNNVTFALWVVFVSFSFHRHVKNI